MAYLRLESWGERLGVAPHPSLTPPEYAERWQSWLSRSQASPALTRSAASAIGDLTDLVQRRAVCSSQRQTRRQTGAHPLVASDAKIVAFAIG